MMMVTTTFSLLKLRQRLLLLNGNIDGDRQHSDMTVHAEETQSDRSSSHCRLIIRV